jgi:hypothetical protein
MPPNAQVSHSIEYSSGTRRLHACCRAASESRATSSATAASPSSRSVASRTRMLWYSSEPSSCSSSPVVSLPRAPRTRRSARPGRVRLRAARPRSWATCSGTRALRPRRPFVLHDRNVSRTLHRAGSRGRPEQIVRSVMSEAIIRTRLVVLPQVDAVCQVAMVWQKLPGRVLAIAFRHSPGSWSVSTYIATLKTSMLRENDRASRQENSILPGFHPLAGIPGP